MKSWLPVCLLLLLAAPAAADRIDDLERKVDGLTQELEALRLAPAAETTAFVPTLGGLAPAASKIYRKDHGVSIGGYGEILFERFDREREDGTAAGELPRVDMLRNVLYVGYKFDDRLLLNTEIEFEHAGVSDEREEGEAAMEFAYLEWSLSKTFGLRGGMLLVPVGLVNEWHEPPVVIGTHRPDVERFIVPTTWSANGIGAFGELMPGLEYRAYVTEGLDANGFTADEGIRDGRQSGAQAKATHPAFSGRLDYQGAAEWLVGVSGYAGNAWQDEQTGGAEIAPHIGLFDAHARLRHRGLEARALYALGTLDDSADLSDALALADPDRLGKRFFGGYVEASYDLLTLLSPGSRYAIAPYARWEDFDTQDDVPNGTENPANHQTIVTLGLGARLHPNVIVKVDRMSRSNDAETSVSQWNIQFGYLY
jgi:hypothetical protein